MRCHTQLAALLKGMLLVSIVFVLPTQTLAAIPASEVSKIAESITVLIDSQYPGSGVLLHRQGKIYTVLTAGHVVQHADLPYQVVTPDGKRYPVNYKTVKKLPGVDLAILEFSSDLTYTAARLGDSGPVIIGSVVYTAGFPAPGTAVQDRIYQFTEGKISGRPLKVLADGYALIYNNSTWVGMSGGPILDVNGHLIGINGRADSDTVQANQTGAEVQVKTGRNLGIPISTFLKLSDQVGIKLDLKARSAERIPPEISASVAKTKAPANGSVSPSK